MLFIRTAHSFQTYVLCGRSETAQHYLARPVLPTHSRIPHTVWEETVVLVKALAKALGELLIPVSWADFWDLDLQALIDDYSLVYQSLTETDYRKD